MPSGAKSVPTFCLERKLPVIVAVFLSRFYLTLTVSLMGLKRMSLLGSTEPKTFSRVEGWEPTLPLDASRGD